MKKLTTKAMLRTPEVRHGTLTVGLDWVTGRVPTVLDQAGEVLLEQKVNTTPKTIREVFGGLPRSRIALEGHAFPMGKPVAH